MSAYFRWTAAPKRRQSKVGDRRLVSRFLWWPTTIGGETRWLGVERIEQEAYMGWCQPPEMKGYECLKWRNAAWDDEPRYTITAAGRAHMSGKK